MSGPARKKEKGMGKEAVFAQMETHVQYENGQIYPFVLEKYLMSSTVAEAKNTILNFEILKVGLVQPKDIAISLIMPGKIVGEASIEKEMDETKKMEDYLDDINCCSVIKLKRINSDQAAAGGMNFNPVTLR